MPRNPEELSREVSTPDARIGVVDAAKILEPWYTPQTTFVEQARLTRSDTALVTYTIPDYQVGLKARDMVRGRIVRDGNTISNTFTVDDPNQGEHTQGHLKTFRLFAGYQGLGTIMESMEGYRLAKFRFVTFGAPTVPEDLVTSLATIVKDDGASVTIDPATVHNQRRGRHTYMRGGIFVPEAPIPEPESAFARHQLFEVLAQFGGAAYYAMRGDLPEGKNPIYVGLGGTQLTDAVVRAGDQLTGMVTAIEMIDEDFAEFSIILRRGEEDIIPKSKVKMGFASETLIRESLKQQLHS